jgi:hypothetical protein
LSGIAVTRGATSIDGCRRSDTHHLRQKNIANAFLRFSSASRTRRRSARCKELRSRRVRILHRLSGFNQIDIRHRRIHPRPSVMRASPDALPTIQGKTSQHSSGNFRSLFDRASHLRFEEQPA